MSLNNLLNQSVTLYNQSSYDEYGRVDTGSGITVQARVQPKQTRRLLANGDVLVVDAIAYVPADTSVSTDDRIDHGGISYKVLNKYPTPDGKGDTHFIKLELLKWQT